MSTPLLSSHDRKKKTSRHNHDRRDGSKKRDGHPPASAKEKSTAKESTGKNDDGHDNNNPVVDPVLARIHHPGSLVNRLIETYLLRVEILIATITEMFKVSTTDTSRRETLAKKLKEATMLKAEIAACRDSVECTLEFVKAEIQRCNNCESIDIHDVFKREATLCNVNAGASFAFDIKALAKEYLRIAKHATDANGKTPATAVTTATTSAPTTTTTTASVIDRDLSSTIDSVDDDMRL